MSIEDNKIPVITDKSEIESIILTMNKLINFVMQELIIRLDSRFLAIDSSLYQSSRNIKSFENIRLESTINFKILKVDKNINANSIISLLTCILRDICDNFELACDSKDMNFYSRYLIYTPSERSRNKDYVIKLVTNNIRYSMSIQYKDPIVKYVDANTFRCKMNFKAAYDMMRSGYKITRPCFDGIYWTLSSDGKTITENCGKYKTAVGTISDIAENVMANDWQIVDNEE